MFWNKKKSSTANDLHEFIEHSPIPIANITEDAHIVIASPSLCNLLHFDAAAIAKSPVNFTTLLSEDQRERFLKALEKCFANTEGLEPLSIELHATDSKEMLTVSVYFNTKRSTDADGRELCSIMLIDSSEQKNLEMRFAHSQKMQAVGQLAGGVAHDFNNLLTAMIGFCDLLLMRHPAGDPSFADIMQIKQNANRAANLVRQLLAFSRRQTLQPKKIDVTELLAELANLIRRLIGENITLNMVHGRDLGSVKADQGQLEQVIINLAVNARDAMKDGGTLDITSRNITIKGAFPLEGKFLAPEDDEIANGDYVLVEITDSGCGIPSDLMKKVFEPFFSTKEIGQGTGLGLATVFGIIRQTGGHIYVKSAEGEGTTFALFFPHNHDIEPIANTNSISEDKQPASDLTGAATIMLVEDETPVRIFAARALRNKGYEVLEADCGENALEVFEEKGDSVDIIVTDVIMPGMNGPTMVDTLEKKYPEKLKTIKVIFISGYAEDAFLDTYGTEREFNFLPKPFTLKQIASKIKEVLQG